jgi:hypothetical protein
MEIAGHLILGARRAEPRRIQVGQMPADRQVDVWTKASSGIVKYGFSIELRDLEPPRTGIFDGRRLVIDPDVGFEMQCFILLHLFGHSVQWVAPSLEHKLAALQTTTDKEAFLKVLKQYEYEAAQYGLKLMHEVGLRDLDAWYADFVETDWKYVERFYREDRIPPWDECLLVAQAPIIPLPIPPLVHRDVQVRYAF